MRLFPLVFLAFWLNIACKPDPKLPQWDTRVATPLLHSRIDMRDLVADSSLKVDPNGNLSLIYRQRLNELIPTEIVAPLNESFHNVIKLSGIDLGTRRFEDFISLGELASNGTTGGALINANNGQRAIIPALAPQGPRSFPVDASKLFQLIVLSSGTLVVEIENNLPVALTDIDFRLQNSGSGLVIAQSNVDTIKALSSYTKQFSLANQSIEGKLEAVLQRFSSPGSQGDTILIDTTDRVTVRVTLRDLVPKAAEAIFPAQTLANDTSLTEEVKVGNAQLTAIEVASGSIYIDSRSTILDKIKLDYEIPGATLGGSSLALNEVIPAAPPGGHASSYREEDLSNYRIDLTGLPGSNGVYNRFYTILRGRIDSSGNLTYLSLNDSVDLKTGIRNLTASKGFGYLGRDTLAGTERSTVDFFDFLGDYNFDLSEFILKLEVDNYLGAPLSFSLNSLRSVAANDSLALTFNSLNQQLSIPAATFGALQPLPGKFSLEINTGNSNIDELIELRPRKMISRVTAVINANLSTPDHNQFIFSDFGLRSYLTAEIPLDLKIGRLRFSDTIDFDYSDYDPEGQLQEGNLKLIGRNHFPMRGGVNVRLVDGNGRELTVLTPSEEIMAATVNSDGRAIAEVESIVSYPLDKDAIEALKKCRQVVLDIQLKTSPEGVAVKIANDDYLDITLAGDLNIRTRK